MEDKITIKKIIEAVKEKSLSKDDLENYRDSMSSVSALFYLELADIEKKEAIFFSEKDPKETDVSTKRHWQVTNEGLRQIELKNYIRATDKLLSSLKSRLYSQY